jgi:hypothetical protein
MSPFWTGRLAPIVSGLALLGAIGCGSGETRTCQQSGVAEFCFVGKGQNYEAVGQGFLPGSEVLFDAGGGDAPARARPIRADANGKVPEAGHSVGVSRDVEPQRVTVEGTAGNGAEVHFEFTIPARNQ